MNSKNFAYDLDIFLGYQNPEEILMLISYKFSKLFHVLQE